MFSNDISEKKKSKYLFGSANPLIHNRNKSSESSFLYWNQIIIIIMNILINIF